MLFARFEDIDYLLCALGDGTLIHFNYQVGGGVWDGGGVVDMRIGRMRVVGVFMCVCVCVCGCELSAGVFACAV